MGGGGYTRHVTPPAPAPVPAPVQQYRAPPLPASQHYSQPQQPQPPASTAAKSGDAARVDPAAMEEVRQREVS